MQLEGTTVLDRASLHVEHGEIVEQTTNCIRLDGSLTATRRFSRK